ncbi:hypothetical protein FACS1894182_10030 [Bacteroidia bacterium]|nr:hypothetical protein FACS1894182_10030 [Bacteroidia bacterium]
MIDEMKVVKFSENTNNHYRSRFLKTTMRKHISGDFLYIDCDTIICEDLSEIETLNILLGAVLDCHVQAKQNRSFLWHQGQDNRLSFCSIGKLNKFFNGGLIYCKDSEISHQFFDKWNELWLYSVSCGINMDQPAFNQTNYLFNDIIYELSGSWNCQIHTAGGLPYLHNAKILHYLTTYDYTDFPFLLSRSEIFEKIKPHGKIPSEIKELLQEPRAQFDKTTLILLCKNYEAMFNHDVRRMGLSTIFKIFINRILLKLTGKILNRRTG